MPDRPKGVLEKAVVAVVACTAIAKGVKGSRRVTGPGTGDGRAGDNRAGDNRAGDNRAGDNRAGDNGAHDGGPGDREEPTGVRAGVAKLDAYQRSHPWLGLPLATFKKFSEDQAGNLAALISYYTFFSLFPLLLALVTVLGLVLEGSPELQDKVLGSALAQFPVIGDQIQQNIGSLSGNGTALVIGLGGALWAGMGAVDAAQNAMNSIWDVPIKDKPKFLARRLRSLLMLVVLGGGLFATAACSSVAGAAESLHPALRLAAPILSVAVSIGVFMVAFRVLTQRDLGWGEVLPGAAVAGTLAVAFQVAGSFYIEHSLKGASQTYGTFAIVIGLLSWLYLQAQVTLLAAEVNVVRSRRLWPRALVQAPDRLTEADRRALAAHAEVEERVEDEDVRTAVPGETRERGVDRPAREPAACRA